MTAGLLGKACFSKLLDDTTVVEEDWIWRWGGSYAKQKVAAGHFFNLMSDLLTLNCFCLLQSL